MPADGAARAGQYFLALSGWLAVNPPNGQRGGGGNKKAEKPPVPWRGFSAFVLTDRYRDSTLLVLSLPAEAVEFSLSYTAEKCVPFIRSKTENRPPGVPAVADTDLVIGQARHLDAVAVGETQRALNPVRTRTRFGWAFERRSSHVITSLIVEYYPKCAGYEL
jgi:hypothetical protein